MTDRWSYVVALPLIEYYNEEMWRQLFPPDEDDDVSDDNQDRDMVDFHGKLLQMVDVFAQFTKDDKVLVSATDRKSGKPAWRKIMTRAEYQVFDDAVRSDNPQYEEYLIRNLRVRT